MPSRVIRGEINSSSSLSRVSMQADLTFRALLVAVDDFGRMDARAALLKAALFPARREATPEKIEKWLAQLEKEGCVQLYEAKGKRYLALPGWETHRGHQKRGAESRFPAPPEIRGFPGRSPEIPTSGSGSVGLGDERDPRGSPGIPGGRAPRSSVSGPTDPPERLSDDDRRALATWAHEKGLNLSNAMLLRAEEAVLDWARSKGSRKKSWLATVRNGIRDGWAIGRRNEGKAEETRDKPRPIDLQRELDSKGELSEDEKKAVRVRMNLRHHLHRVPTPTEIVAALREAGLEAQAAAFERMS